MSTVAESTTPIRTDRVPPPPPPRISTVTLKVTMAVTGTIFALFVLVHMIGNLKVYGDAAGFDAYAHWLRTLLEPLLPYEGVLWLLRIILLVSLIAHVTASFMLVARGRRARGAHRRRKMGLRRLPATLMPYTGLVLLVFIVVHILDLTTGTRPIASDSFIATTHDTSHAYANLVTSFERWPMAVFYIVVMVLLGLHLVQGLWSVFNDFGATGKRLRQVGVAVALVISVVVMIGNLSIPIAVLAGAVS